MGCGVHEQIDHDVLSDEREGQAKPVYVKRLSDNKIAQN